MTTNANVLKMDKPVLFFICILGLLMIGGGYMFNTSPITTDEAPQVDASSVLGNLTSGGSEPENTTEAPPNVNDVLSRMVGKQPEAVPTLVVDKFTQELMNDQIKAKFDGIPKQGRWTNVDMTSDTFKAKAAIVARELKAIDGKPIEIQPDDNNGEAWVMTPIIGWHKCMSIIDLNTYDGALDDAEFWFATPKAFRQAMIDVCNAMRN